MFIEIEFTYRKQLNELKIIRNETKAFLNNVLFIILLDIVKYTISFHLSYLERLSIEITNIFNHW